MPIRAVSEADADVVVPLAKSAELFKFQTRLAVR